MHAAAFAKTCLSFLQPGTASGFVRAASKCDAPPGGRAARFGRYQSFQGPGYFFLRRRTHFIR